MHAPVTPIHASANILAQHGRQKTCEDVLATTGSIYKRYAAELRDRGAPEADVPRWRQRQIAAAQPVTSTQTSFRSDELVGPRCAAHGTGSSAASKIC